MGENEFQQPSELPQIVEIYNAANHLLKELDRLQMHQAAAYLATAIDVIRRDYPQLARPAD